MAVFAFWLFVMLMLVLIFALPAWPYSRSWGYYPSGTAAALAILMLIFAALGVFVIWWPWTPPAL